MNYLCHPIQKICSLKKASPCFLESLVVALIKSITLLFADAITADGIWSGKGPSRIGKTGALINALKGCLNKIQINRHLCHEVVSNQCLCD